MIRCVLSKHGRVLATKPRSQFDPKSFLTKLGIGRSIVTYDENQIVFSQGDQADAVFYIQKGKVKVTVLSEQGKEAVVAMLGTNDFFGEGCLGGQTQRIATVTTMTECVIMRLERAAIVEVIHEQPAFSELFIAHLLSRTIRYRGGSGRSAVQFERETPRAVAAAAGELRQGRQTDADDREDQPGDARRNDRHDAVAREFFHEQVS